LVNQSTFAMKVRWYRLNLLNYHDASN
jgi:hypothetical protein